MLAVWPGTGLLPGGAGTHPVSPGLGDCSPPSLQVTGCCSLRLFRRFLGFLEEREAFGGYFPWLDWGARGVSATPTNRLAGSLLNPVRSRDDISNHAFSRRSHSVNGDAAPATTGALAGVTGSQDPHRPLGVSARFQASLQLVTTRGPFVLGSPQMAL